jgi:sec-independent protein translocase protein TatB
VIDLGFEKLAIVGAVALIVIGPEKLPRVARTVGTLLGKAQRYVADVKAEVNRSIELEELHRMKSQFETAAKDVQQTVHQHVGEAGDHLRRSYDEVSGSVTGSSTSALGHSVDGIPASVLPPAYTPPKKNWRLKRSATPQWFKQRAGVRMHAQSGAARVARFRPRPPGSR